MKAEKGKWLLEEADYGVLWPFVCRDTITDIDYNGSSLWVCDLIKGRYQVEGELPGAFVEQFCEAAANSVSAFFNPNAPVVEAETNGLRITALHASIAPGGTCFCIRKTPERQRMTKEIIVSSGYASEPAVHLLANCVKAGLSMVICGGMGSGKTELIKYLTHYIPDNEKTVTIEDTSELHFKKLHPKKDCIELLVDDNFTFADALKHCLRLNADRVILSEARSREVEYLMENVSFGVGCITSLHTDDVRNVPDRIKNMYPEKSGLEQVENDVYRFINVGVFLRKRQFCGESVRRFVEQICFYTRNGSNNIITMAFDERQPVEERIPEEILKRMRNKDIFNPYENPDEGGKRCQSMHTAKKMEIPCIPG